MARIPDPHKEPHNRKAGVEHRNKKRRSRWHRRKNNKIYWTQVRSGQAMVTFEIVQRTRGRMEVEYD